MKPRSRPRRACSTRAGEAMQDAAQAAGSPVLADERQAVVPGVLTVVGRAAVNDDGQLGRFCQFHLLQEDSFLHVSWRVIVKVVQSDLAPGDDSGMARPLCQAGVCRIVCQTGFVGMNSHTRPDFRVLRFPVVFFRQLNTAVGRVGAVAVADGEIGNDAALLRASQHLVAVSVVALALEMSVRVDKHVRREGQPPPAVQPSEARQRRRLFQPACPPAHLPRSLPAPASRHRGTRRRSCRLTPARAASAARGSRRSRLCGRSAIRAHRPRRFQRPVDGLRFRDRLPAAAVYRPLLRARPS